MTAAENEKVNRSAWATLAILSCLGLVTMYGETMVLPAIPDFIRDFGISYNTSSWILSSYLIAGAVMTPIAGKLSDIYGKKRVLLIVMVVYSAGILAGGFADSIWFMLAARVAQGTGVAMFPIAFGIIREALPERKLAIGQTIFSSTFSGGAVVGLLVGATIIHNYGWHTTFFTIFPVAAGLALTIKRFIHVKGVAAKERSIDIKGTVALAATVISFLAGISFLESAIESGMSLQAAGLFAISAVSLAIFIVVEKKTSFPLIDAKLLTHRMLLPAIIILMLVGLCTFMVYQTIPVMIRSPEPFGFGGDAVAAANVQLPFMAILLAGTVGSGFVINRIGNLRLTAIGTALGASGFFGLLAFHSTGLEVATTLAIISAGLSLSFTGGFNIVLLSAPLRSTGIALGMTLLLNLVGQSTGPTIAAMFQQMYQGTTETLFPDRFPTAEAYNLIFVTAAVISLMSASLALALNWRQVAPPINVGSSEKTD